MPPICLCNPGYYDPIVYDDNATKLHCEPCPYGTTCNSSGITVHSLVIHRGYFRISNSTADVRQCPDMAAVVSLFSRPSGCKGGEGGGDALCRDKLGGVYCSTCREELQGTHYYDAAERECRECGLQSIPIGFWLLLGLLASAAVAWLVNQFARGKAREGMDLLLGRMRRVASSSIVASLAVTIKTLIGFYQIVSEVEEVFIMELPAKSIQLINSFSRVRHGSQWLSWWLAMSGRHAKLRLHRDAGGRPATHS